MRVATYENGALNFLTDPFYVDKQKNEQHYFSVEGDTQDVVLYAKCNIEGENMFRDRMIGGVFEGSNQPNFAVKDTLFIIQSKPDRLNTTVRSSSNKEYRYIRYVGPPGGLCNVAEVAFYEKNDTVALSGKVISMTERMNIPMCLMEKRGLLLIILNLPEDGQGLIWVEGCG